MLLALQFVSMASTAEIEVPGFYDVILKEDASMSAGDHAQWATKIHLENKHSEVDDLFGLTEGVKSDSYVFATWEDTMEIIRQHPDVSTSVHLISSLRRREETNVMLGS